MIRRSLFAKLAAALSLILLGIGLLYVILSATLAHHYERVFLQSFNQDLAANLVTERNLVEDGALNQEALKETFHHYMVVNPSIEIYLLDRDGTILSYSADPGKVKRKRVDLGPVRDFLAGKNFPLLGDDPRSYERRKVFSATPVPSSDQPQGYLYVVLRGEEHERIEQVFENNFLLQLSGTALFVSLFAGLVVGLILFRLLTRRLQSLAELMRSFSENNFTEPKPYPVHNRHDDEIEALGRHYNSMAGRIREQLDALKKQDELRRDLVANVSHDLRTPLAALHAYIETLKLKSEEFDANTRSEYLDTALRHSQHLTRLVEELFDLARLEASETPLHREAFAPAELVQDVIQKFRLAADERQVQLAMHNTETLPFVDADIALVERVLENLLSNALRHTPAGGRVTVRLTAQPSAVEIRVQDSGDGISEQDLPYIFDRFYRGKNTDSRDHHAGLGLAIAQRIMMLHGGNIKVSSHVGEGAEFFFTLPVSKLQ
jgi:signal transduction histidine kinase